MNTTTTLAPVTTASNTGCTKAEISAPLTMGESYRPAMARKHRRSQRPWDTKGEPFDPTRVVKSPGAR